MKNKFDRKILISMVVVGIVYFALMIFSNFTGAKNINMLAIFEKDEFAQIKHVLRMLTPGETLYDTLRHFFVYLHYFYGYPFYLFSAIMMLPYRLLAGTDWGNNIAVTVLLLRQLVSVLPMIISIGLMVGLQTKKKSIYMVLGLFVFLLSIPAVILNNFWWHPDSLAILLVVLTIFFIDRDEFQYGKYFYLAAITCGIAFSVKYAGAFFVLAIPTYLIWGIVSRKIVWRRAFFLALSFVLVMFVALLISNPLLLLPQERDEIIQIQQLQFVQTRIGYYSVNPDWNLSVEKINRIVWPYYAQWFTLILLVAGLIKGIASSRFRLINVMILMYILPYIFTVGTSSIRPLYFLPVIIPLASSLVHLFPENISFRGDVWRQANLQSKIQRLLPWGLLILLLGQFGIYIQKDIEIYDGILYREERSESIAFYQDVENLLVEHDLDVQQLKIYRDPTAYVPPKPNYEILMKWKLASYDYLNATQPDLLLLEMAYVLEFAKPDAIENAVDPGDMIAWQQFYGDAYADQLPGYSIFFQNEYGLALIRSELLK
ncbi:MAG: hypothetical protein ISS57_12375 [Anaerolineales bacterium]|nr:hypothetical protein [Anaerolineales bacterium]